MSELPAAVHALITQTEMLSRGSRVVVAVSGGQDSCALLHALAMLREDLGVSLHAAHLNHGFRGEEAEADATFVVEFASTLGIACTVERVDVPQAMKRLHLSAQEAARRIRHRFLERVADEIDAERIALGHTRDDRVETILLHLLRGAGMEGLRGLMPIAGRRVRPLLTVSREDTAAYCRRYAIAYREDSSNRSLAYRRNRLRAELLPSLETYYNPEVRQILLRFADLAVEDSALLDELAAVALEQMRRNAPAGVAGLDNSMHLASQLLIAHPRAIRRRVVRRAIAAVRGSLENIEFAAIERILHGLEESFRKERGFQFTLPPGNIYVYVDVEFLSVFRSVFRRQAPSVARFLEYPLPIHDHVGTVTVPEWGLVFHAECRSMPVEIAESSDAWRVCLDADVVSSPLSVRSRRPGDRMQPLGMTGTKKLQDLFVDRKEPEELRDRVPIIADAEGILWVVGHTISERARIRPNTQRVLILQMEPAPP